MAIDATRPDSARAAAGASAEGPDSFEVHNPADGSTITTLPVDRAAQVAETVARVRANQPEWEALGIKGRAR
jgi:acyl-CoA reductase-like NAD-dependent aldehyde dehydrogenase